MVADVCDDSHPETKPTYKLIVMFLSMTDWCSNTVTSVGSRANLHMVMVERKILALARNETPVLWSSN
jgi:hypothetical protein